VVSRLGGAYRQLVVAKKVTHNITDQMINVFRNTSIEESTYISSILKIIFILKIESMVLKISGSSPNWPILRWCKIVLGILFSNVQDSRFVGKTIFWKCGGKTQGGRISFPRKFLVKIKIKWEEKMVCSKRWWTLYKIINGKPFKYNKATKLWDKQFDTCTSQDGSYSLV